MGRKKKTETKSYMYKNVIGIVLIFLGILIIIANLQPENIPLKIYILGLFGFSSLFFGALVFYLGLLISPILKFNFINKSTFAGIFLLFMSTAVVDGITADPSFAGKITGSFFSSMVGYIGSIIISLMFALLGAYFVFKNRFTNSLKRMVEVTVEKTLGLYEKYRTTDDEILDNSESAEEMYEENKEELDADVEEDFNMESFLDDEIEGDKEDKQQNNQVESEEENENEPYEFVDSVSEPVSLVKSGNSTSSKKSQKEGVSSISNSSDKKNKGSKPKTVSNESQKKQKDSPEKKENKLPLRDTIWEYPPLSLLNKAQDVSPETGDTEKRSRVIEKTLDSFGINAKVVDVNVGPTVTQYAINVDEGTKIAKITNLQSDLALALASPDGQVRIEAPIPGKSLVGIEVPNISQEIVTLKTMLKSKKYKRYKKKSQLSICLGKDVTGVGKYYPLNKMPHMLIAGATGSGKSVMIHSIMSTLLFNNSPDECKFILVDPKRVELVNYNEIPHLITPVITQTNEAVKALKWVVGEMERRLEVLSNYGARNIASYNQKSGFQAMPYIVVVLDELADLMMTSSNEVEKSIVRIAQLSRATGIHLVIATQRPSTDIITGSIKANIPARIAFNVASQVDSRVIIDSSGAEKLLGKGDMLFVSPESSKRTRIQGVFVQDEEINRLVSFLKASDLEPDFEEDVLNPSGNVGPGSTVDEWEDEKFPDAVKTVLEYDRGSASLLQRKLSVGYARAARILDELEEHGVVGPKNGSKPRDVLISSEDEVLG